MNRKTNDLAQKKKSKQERRDAVVSFSVRAQELLCASSKSVPDLLLHKLVYVPKTPHLGVEFCCGTLVAPSNP